MSSESEVWKAVMQLLEGKIEREVTFQLWFSDLSLQKLIDDRAYLQTTNLYKKKIIESRFFDQLNEAFEEVMGFPIKITIISIESRSFEEQFLELLGNEAEEQFIEEEKKKGIVFDPEYIAPDPNAEPEKIEPRSFKGEYKLPKQNLNFPKVYNPESDQLEDLELIKYLEELGNKEGMLLMSQSVPEYRPSYTFENFVVGDSNKTAYAYCFSVAQYPAAQYNPLFLYGPPGIGKTHLLYAIAHHVERTRPSYNIVYCTSEDFTNELVAALTHKTTAEFREKYRTADILMIDDIQFIGGKEATQLEFFHTFNTLYKANKQIIVAGDRPPKDIAVLEKRIRSRFESGAIVDIGQPDVELRAAIIRRKSMDMKVDIPNDAVQYIADNVKDNVRQIEGIIKNINGYALLTKVPISEELVRSIVGNVVTGPIEINPDKIVDAVSRHTGVGREDILGKKHTKNITMARHITSYLLRTLAGMTLQDIGAFIGRHHSTVYDSVRFVEEEMKNDGSLSDQMKGILKDLGQ